MKGRTTIYSALTAVLLLSASMGIAADNSGFLTDYSKLKPIDGSEAMLYQPQMHIPTLRTIKR